MPVLAQDLRDTILQAALCGKLSKPLNSDTKIEDTLETIKIKKDNYKWEKGKKKIKFNADLKVDIDIPSHWKVVKLGQISSILGRIGFRGFTKSDFTDNSGSICLTPGNLTPSNKMSYFKLSYIYKTKYDESPEIQVAEGDILLVKTGSSFGKAAIVTDLPKEATINPQLVRIVEHGINPIFLLTQFSSVFGKKQFNSFVTGTATPTFSQEKIANFNVLFPPIEEQQRIVDKLNEIMPLIDEYEKFENQLVELKKKFPDDMKAAILQAAMEGKLTKQLKSDSSVDELLKSIQQEKELLIKEKKIKKEKLLAPISDDEIPFDIPNSWRWVRLGNIGNWRAGATPLKSNNNYYSGGTIPWLLTGDLNDDYIDDVPNRITKLALESTSVKLIPKGSVLIAMYGATIGKLGILNIDLTTNQACCACTTFSSISNLYLFYFLLSYRKQFISQGEGGAQPNISKEKITQTLIPIPPIEEQQRIVDKLDQLLPLCDALANLEQEVA